jgi:uncharacterized membrane protein YbaN (DUF454 family)
MLRKHAKRILVIVLGVIFFILGVIGLVLPLVPQGVFFVISIILFSMVSPAIREKLERYTRRYPWLHKLVVKIEERTRRIIGDI